MTLNATDILDLKINTLHNISLVLLVGGIHVFFFPSNKLPSVLISQNSLVVGVVYERGVVVVVCFLVFLVFVCALCLFRGQFWLMVCSLSPLILVELRMSYILTPCICSIVVTCCLSLYTPKQEDIGPE